MSPSPSRKCCLGNGTPGRSLLIVGSDGSSLAGSVTPATGDASKFTAGHGGAAALRTVWGPNGPAALPQLPSHLLLVRDLGVRSRGQGEAWGTGAGQEAGISSRVRHRQEAWDKAWYSG